MLRGLLRHLPMLHPLCESRCVSCSSPIPFQVTAQKTGTPPLCTTCTVALARRVGGFCPRCGEITASPDIPPTLCGECLKKPPPWDAFFFHGSYQGLLRSLILRFKHGHDLSPGHLLGRFLADHPGITGEYDALVPMPLHPRRLRERGFNQALEAARPLAAKYGLPLAPESLVRMVHTPPQAGLSLAERNANVRDIFAASGVLGKRLLLVDDVATTGSSLRSAAKTLLRAGAAGVAVAVVARTPSL